MYKMPSEPNMTPTGKKMYPMGKSPTKMIPGRRATARKIKTRGFHGNPVF